MTDNATPQGDTTPEPPKPTTPPAATPQPAPAADKTDKTEIKLTSAQLAERLERERQSMLKALGIETVETGKAAIDELKKRRDAEKTERQKLDEELAQLKREAARLPALEAALNAQADAAMSALTEGQRAAVLVVAPTDKAHQLSVICAMRPTWAQLAAVGAEPAKPDLAAVPAPANTMSNVPAPPPAQPGQPIDWLALYKSHEAAGRFHLSARVLVDHPEIAPQIHKGQ